MTPRLEIREIAKSFGGVQALSGVSFEIAPGEVHAICGENGAGKSTLNRILAGLVRPDSGAVLLEGMAFDPASVGEAENSGVVIVHQESVVFHDLDSADNLFLMREPSSFGGLWLDRGKMASQTREALARLGEDFTIDQPLGILSLAQRQMVGIARALSHHCRLLIVDEPTASLSSRETDALFQIIRQLRTEGVSILYVSHRLEEIFALADRVTVLRDGKHVATKTIRETSREELIRLMVGREIERVGGTSRDSKGVGEVLLSVEGLSRGQAFKDISFDVRAGEVVGLAGLVGAGRSEVARAIFGVDLYESGRISLAGAALPRGSSSSSIRTGIAYVPEDRQEEGLHLPLSVRENLSLAVLRQLASGGLVRRREEGRHAEEAVRKLGVRTATIESPVESLSGGNQQKVLFGKWLATEPRILILDEPTRGVDVGAKAEIHGLIRQWAENGAAVLLISSELPEVLSLSDRILVMRQGRISGELKREEATSERILELALPREEIAKGDGLRARAVRPEAGILGLLILIAVTALLANPSFFAASNVRDMLVKVAPAAIVACGLTFVILAREIDISVGSLMGLCAASLGLAGSADRLGWPAWASIGLCLGVGLIGGLVNGLLVAYGRVPSIIVTLGTLTIFSGMTEKLLGGEWIQNMPAALRQFGTGTWAIWAAALVGLASIWLSMRTPFGRRIFALGSNPRAAHAIGIPTRALQLKVFALTGFLCGVAALFSATQLQVIESGFGKGFELAVVAAVVVGGTSIRGGQGSVIGSLIGALTLGIVGTFLIFLKLGETATYWERAIQGGLILVAVVADHVWRRRRV